ncbi:mannose-6-phosphate isomerase-like [Actinia tenebrosa]|uniref:Mannose-6-phosphate isomerase n=1 Tax=Actinia tenebrosa TaxID=6105 RepID=A0A6P8II82_ACTTE|nr:mannose-6-phosphate isomerase-like [Actinia tenebrosa]
MGTHPNGPSQVLDSHSSEAQSLLEWINSHDGCLGSKVSEIFGGKLPFLFKVLSVNKALSIQAHPNKEHAEKLHASRPDVYKDPNHKPEMAIAITEYEGLCGFRPTSEVKEYLENVAEFAAIIGDAATSLIQSSDDAQAKVGLKKCFTALMTTPSDSVKKHLDSLVSKIKAMKEKGQDSSLYLGDLITRLNSQFPGDVGCFCAYFLNHVVLQPGEAMFLGPNLPHAYLSGDCMECMACSDNVVRAGLTPKYKDVETLCEMLEYKPSTASDNIFQPHKDPSDPCITVYDPPVKDFSVMKIQVPFSNTVSTYKMKPLNGPSILIVISGSATLKSSGDAMGLGRGNVIFIPASSQVSLEFEKEELVMFQAYCDPQ